MTKYDHVTSEGQRGSVSHGHRICAHQWFDNKNRSVSDLRRCYPRFGARFLGLTSRFAARGSRLYSLACFAGQGLLRGNRAVQSDFNVSTNMNSAVSSNYREDISVADRIVACDWKLASQELDAQGHTLLKALLSVDECARLARLYSQDEIFRSRVVMARHGFGSGEYKYFRYPLPKLVAELRSATYSHLVETANHGMA